MTGEELKAGDFLDGIKHLRSKGMTLIYIASQFGLRPASLRRYLDWGRPPGWLIGKYADNRERLEAEAEDAEIADSRDFITRLAHYMASEERVDVNWRFPFNKFPEPEEKHTKAAEDIGRAGSVPALALELLKRDFHIKRTASFKMFQAQYRIRDFAIPNWCGLWGWLDLWCHALRTTRQGRRFLHYYAGLSWRWIHKDREVTDERSDVFARIDRLHRESAESVAGDVPEWYTERKSDAILKALRSGRGQVAQFRLENHSRH